MSEYVHVPISLWGIRDGIAEATMTVLVDQGKLPADFEFRALTIDDSNERQQIALQDVRAALKLGKPTEHPYLTQALPNCVVVPVAQSKTRTAILREISTDYHQLGTLLHIADDQQVERSHGYQAWAAYVKFLNPEKYVALQQIRELGPQRGTFSRLHNYRSYLGDIVIRDSGLMPIYENPKLITKHGPVKQGLLRLLLQDNHPEIEVLFED